MDKRIIGVGVVLVILQLAVGAAAFSASSSADNAKQELEVARGDIQKLEARIKVLEKKSRLDFSAPEEHSESVAARGVRASERAEESDANTAGGTASRGRRITTRRHIVKGSLRSLLRVTPPRQLFTETAREPHMIASASWKLA